VDLSADLVLLVVQHALIVGRDVAAIARRHAALLVPDRVILAMELRGLPTSELSVTPASTRAFWFASRSLTSARRGWKADHGLAMATGAATVRAVIKAASFSMAIGSATRNRD
jgi:hypothetical protein